MAKLPFYQMYPDHFDRDLNEHDLEIRGAWVTIMNKLWNEPTRGEATKTVKQWARVLGVSPEDTERILRYIMGEEIGDVEFVGKHITIICRRQVREEMKRTASARRQKTFREKGGGNPEKWTAIRVHILERDGYICAYCGRKATTVDHIIPRSKGGDENEKNLVACCKKCNLKKNNLTLFKAKMTFWSGHIFAGKESDYESNTESNVNITPDITYNILHKDIDLNTSDTKNQKQTSKNPCPIMTQDGRFEKHVSIRLKDMGIKDIGPNEAHDVARVFSTVCRAIKKRWFYEECDEGYASTCFKFADICLDGLKEQIKKKTPIKNRVAYLAGIVEKEINEYGEDNFKPAQLRRNRGKTD